LEHELGFLPRTIHPARGVSRDLTATVGPDELEKVDVRSGAEIDLAPARGGRQRAHLLSVEIEHRGLATDTQIDVDRVLAGDQPDGIGED